MSDVLRRVYEGCGALDRYFEGKTPVARYRGRPFGDSSDPMQPTLIGWYTRLRPRNPNVLLLDDRSRSPQYVTGLTNGDLLTEDRQQRPVTAEILRNAGKLIVKGCRTMSGLHRGISVFHKTNPRLKMDWFELKAGAKLDAALAVTRDQAATEGADPIHYTVAPKDDMSLALFLQYLKALGDQATPS